MSARVNPFHCTKERTKVERTGARMKATKKRIAGREKRKPVRAVVCLMAI
jgi:hypothetical protein